MNRAATSKTSLTLTYRAFCNRMRLISHSVLGRRGRGKGGGGSHRSSMTIAAVAATAGQQRRGEWGGRCSGAHQSQEVSLGARVLNSRYLLALPVLACRRQVDDGNGIGDGDGGIGGNDNRDRMLQIRYCFTLRLHSAFRISIVSPCLCRRFCCCCPLFLPLSSSRCAKC